MAFASRCRGEAIVYIPDCLCPLLHKTPVRHTTYALTGSTNCHQKKWLPFADAAKNMSPRLRNTVAELDNPDNDSKALTFQPLIEDLHLSLEAIKTILCTEG